MNAIPYDRPEEEWDSYEDEPEAELPGRPRRRVLTWWSAGLFALILCGAGFYAGVRIEKNQLANSSSGGAFSGLTSGAGATARTGAVNRTGAAGSGARTAARGAGAAGGGAAGFRGLFGGAAGLGGAGGATLGTVSNISGNSLVISETSGNSVKVTLSSATKVTKNVTVGKTAVRPGDLVTVSGAKGSDGTISATTVSDIGASPFAGAGGGAGGGSGASSSGSSGSSAVNQLFGGG